MRYLNVARKLNIGVVVFYNNVVIQAVTFPYLVY